MESEHKARTPIKAIRAYCVQCGGGSSNDVKLCPIKDCELYAYRFGHRPSTIARKNAATPIPEPQETQGED
jgi:hypothetical protein